jgi:integrase
MPPKINLAPSAGLYRRGAKWYLRFVPGPGLPQQRVALKVTDYDAALEKAKEVRARPWSATLRPKTVLIEEYLADALRLKQMREVSAGDARRTLKNFVTWMDDHFGRDWELHDLGEKDIEAYRSDLLTRLSDHTVNTYQAMVSGFLEWAVKGKLVPFNPVRKMKYIRTERRPRSLVVPPDVSEKLIRECPRQDIKFILYCGFQHGMRKQEFLSMRPSWAHFDQGAIEIPPADLVEMPIGARRNGAWRKFQTKNGRGRMVPLSEQFEKFLQEEFLFDWEDPTEPFFLHPESSGVRYRWDPRKPFKEYMKSKGLPEVGFHTMRHSYATALAAANVSGVLLAEYLGDDIRVVTRNYLHHRPRTSDLPLFKLPKPGKKKTTWVDAESLDASKNAGDDATPLGEPPPRKRRAAAPKILGGTRGKPPLPSRRRNRKL